MSDSMRGPWTWKFEVKNPDAERELLEALGEVPIC